MQNQALHCLLGHGEEDRPEVYIGFCRAYISAENSKHDTDKHKSNLKLLQKEYGFSDETCESLMTQARVGMKQASELIDTILNAAE